MLLKAGDVGYRALIGKLCLIEVIAWGVLYYTFAVFLPPMASELGWSSAALAAGFSSALFVAGMAAPLVGVWIDRRGSRGLMAVGALAGSLGVAVWSMSTTLLVYFIGWALIGLAMAGTLYAPAFATVVRADPGRSRKAILIITLIGALASTLFMPLASLLGESWGWRAALLVLASLLALVVAPLAASLPKVSPRQEVIAEQDRAPQVQERIPGFGTFALALMIADAVSVVVNVHLVVFIHERGESLQTAAGIAGLAGAAKIGGRLATAAGTGVPALVLLWATFPLTAVALLLPVIWPATWATVLMVLGFGATNGARTVLRPAVVVEWGGSGSFGKNNGLLQLFTTLAKAVGPVAFGLLLGAFGWLRAWPVLAAMLLVSGALLLALRRGSGDRLTVVEATPR
ncbi:MAG: MFS transporter [Acidobacteriota bacterium]